MPDVAHRIEEDLRKQFNVFYDEKGAVGKRYRRQDEIGTPFCITVDGDTLEDDTVTDPRPRLDGAGPHPRRERPPLHRGPHRGWTPED